MFVSLHLYGFVSWAKAGISQVFPVTLNACLWTVATVHFETNAFTQPFIHRGSTGYEPLSACLFPPYRIWFSFRHCTWTSRQFSPLLPASTEVARPFFPRLCVPLKCYPLQGQVQILPNVYIQTSSFSSFYRLSHKGDPQRQVFQEADAKRVRKHSGILDFPTSLVVKTPSLQWGFDPW